MDIRELKERKRNLGYSNEKIAELSGVPLSTVQKIFAGVTQQPRYETLAALDRALDVTRVREAVFQYGIDKKQGDYTIEDYELLPEDVRVELIDGTLYNLSAPELIHQELVGELHHQLKSYIRKNSGECRALMAPFNVHLNLDDNKTMVQPDVAVICDRKKLTKKRVEGAPDLVIEVLSPSTRKRDLGLKLKKYSEADVREYWLVDPDSQKILTYDLENIELPQIYTFRDKVPVAIFKGDCVVDMNVITEEIGFYFDLD